MAEKEPTDITETSSDFLMAQREPTDITETSSDFLTFDRVKSSTTDTVEKEQDVHSLLADTEKIKDFISCRRCNNEFNKDSHRPFLLPCLDGICQMCMLDLQATGKTSYECAKCLTEHVCLTENVVTLQSDVTRELLSEICCLSNEKRSLVCKMCTNHQTASHRCVDCSHFICTDCVKLHENLRQFKSHSVLELKNLLTEKIENLRLFFSSSSKQCPVIGHEKENAILFCYSTSCKKPICMRCAITTHKDHEFRDISEVGKESENEVQNQIGDLLSKADLAGVSLTRLTDLHEKNINKSEELHNEIKKYFSEAKRALELREKTLHDAVSAQLNNEQTSIENEKKRLTSFVGSCKETCYYGRISSEFNNAHSFLDVAESIKSRIKILGDQLHENQIIIETMKFSSEPSITSHVTIIKTIGKLSVSKVIASKSTAVIRPSVYEIHQEVQFKIQLLSSIGKPVVDEDVNIHLELNRKTFTVLPCVLDKSSTSYTGSWIPDKSMQITWIVVSNGIRIETLQGVLDIKGQTQELSTDILQSKVVEMKTTEGLLIKIYEGSITRLDVDCIVNAANEQLMHGGRVAAAISEAAGYQFDKESQQYVENHGPIPVGSCCVTSAGKLPYKCVIHTVEPRRSDYTDFNLCLELLKQSVEVTFITADKEGMNSVAIPPISSGIYGVPKDLCVEQYYKAVMSFCSTYRFKNLREIHFVDRDESMVRAIQTVFQQKEPTRSFKETKFSGNLNETSDKSANDNEKPSLMNKKDELSLSNGYTIMNVSDKFQVKIYLGSITDIDADVIVCPQDKFCLTDNQIAKDIFSKDPGQKPHPGKKEYGDVFSRIPADTVQWKMIFHAVFPVYDSESAKNPTRFGETLNIIIQKIIKKADEGMFSSIAIPLLVEGKEGYNPPIELCAFNFLWAVKRMADEKISHLKYVYLILQNEEDEKVYARICKDIYEIIPRPIVKTKSLGSDQSFGKTLTSKPEKEENCCICIETPTVPKRLKCGHIFCKECIEECFKYKPACPNCGQIYGKVIGDQPPGTLSIRKDRNQKLQGVYDSEGCIVLTYFFHSGYQGEENPSPGKSYKGIQRSGYVPNNEKGRLVAKLLNVAFSRRLVFTIGRSRTTGEDGVITWNDIHHKTRAYGGLEKFGYPDPTYLDRVLEELAAKGVTPESADDPKEYEEYSRALWY